VEAVAALQMMLPRLLVALMAITAVIHVLLRALRVRTTTRLPVRSSNF